MKIYKIILCVFSFLAVSCDDTSWEELNKNPNSPPADTVPLGNFYDAILQEGTLNAHLDQRIHNIYVDTFAQYFISTFSGYSYLSNDGYTADYWKDHYRWTSTLDKYINVGNPDVFPNEISVMRTWRVFLYHRFVDMYGSVPYSDYEIYDNEQEIYKDMLDQLKIAVEGFDSNLPLFKDQIYGGDVAKWKKFANSLRLRLAMRFKDVDASFAKSHAEVAVTGGVLEANADTPYMQPLSGWGNGYSYNYYYGWGGNGSYMSKSFEKMVTNLGGIVFNTDNMPEKESITTYPAKVDPRATILFGDNSTNAGVEDDDKGKWQGLDINTVNPPANYLSSVSWANVFVRGTVEKARTIMPVSEIWFLRAEGALKGWSMGMSDADCYKKGVEVSFDYFGIADEAESYLSSTEKNGYDVSVKYDDGGDKLEKIITQKYLAGFPDNSWEAWVDLRRLELPKIDLHTNAPNSNVPAGKIIQKIKYPSSEAVNNAENYDKVKDQDNEGYKHFWSN